MSPAKVINRRAIFPTVDSCPACGSQRFERHRGSAPGGLQTRLCSDCGEWRKVVPLGYVVTYEGESKSRLEFS